MLCSDEDLDQLREANWWSISPPHTAEEADALIQPSSIDLRLDRNFEIMTWPQSGQVIDPASPNVGLTTPLEVPPGDALLLGPGQFLLGSTWEIVTLSPRLAGRIEGKSSLGRLGLIVHSTAGWIDPGFSGRITLEITNLANRPIRLHPGMAVAQLAVFLLPNGANRPYSADRGSHYQGQRGPTTSRSFERFKVWDLDDSRLAETA